MGKQWKQWETLFSGFQNHCRWWLQPWNLKTLVPWKKNYDKASERETEVSQLCLTLCNPMDYTVRGILQARILEWVAPPFSRESSQPRDWTQVSRIAGGLFTSWTKPRDYIKKQRYYFADKGPNSQNCDLFSSHVWMWELDYKESWVPKNWCFWTVVLEKTLESPLDCKEIQPVHPEGNQFWIVTGRTDAEAEAPILWPPVAKSQLIRKDPWCWERLKAGGEGDDGGRDGWMASQTWWTWVWTRSRSWWWTEKPGVLQRVRHDWTELIIFPFYRWSNWVREIDNLFRSPVKGINLPESRSVWFLNQYFLKLNHVTVVFPNLTQELLIKGCST